MRCILTVRLALSLYGEPYEFTFGDSTSTTLTMERGLPADIYGGVDLLLALHTGNASLQDGKYAMNPKHASQGLIGVSIGQQGVDNAAYSTPQGAHS